MCGSARRVIAEGFVQGERTFGAETDKEQLDRFIRKGMVGCGKVARDGAQSRRKGRLSLGMLWPAEWRELQPWAQRELEFCAQLHGVEFSMQDAGGSASCRSSPRVLLVSTCNDAIMTIFWKLVAVTASIAPDGWFEQIVVPQLWQESIATDIGGHNLPERMLKVIPAWMAAIKELPHDYEAARQRLMRVTAQWTKHELRLFLQPLNQVCTWLRTYVFEMPLQENGGLGTYTT